MTKTSILMQPFTCLRGAGGLVIDAKQYMYKNGFIFHINKSNPLGREPG